MEGLLALIVGVGLGVVHELMELEVDEVIGPKGEHNSDRRAVRHGHEDGSMTPGGRRVGGPPPADAHGRRRARADRHPGLRRGLETRRDLRGGTLHDPVDHRVRRCDRDALRAVHDTVGAGITRRSRERRVRKSVRTHDANARTRLRTAFENPRRDKGFSAMARPGLEPGTPRFSVVTSTRLTRAEIQGNNRFLEGRRSAQKSAICGLLQAVQEMMCTPSPIWRPASFRRELDVGVGERVDLELAAERSAVALPGGEAHVDLLLDAPDVRPRGATASATWV